MVQSPSVRRKRRSKLHMEVERLEDRLVPGPQSRPGHTWIRTATASRSPPSATISLEVTDSRSRLARNWKLRQLVLKRTRQRLVHANPAPTKKLRADRPEIHRIPHQ